MKRTQRDMLEVFPALEKEHDLLQLYLHDTQTGHKPDNVQTESDSRNGIRVRCQLWRAMGAGEDTSSLRI